MVEGRFLGGHFRTPISPTLLSFSSSLLEDSYLLDHDIAGSIAHARSLEKAGLLSPEERGELERHLREVLREIRDGKRPLRVELEDIHMNVEALLQERTPLALKLHTGRSRNDQVALDLRLRVRRDLLDLGLSLLELSRILLSHARGTSKVPFPGLTHFRPAVAISAGHLFHAHAVRFLKDSKRALLAFDEANVSPLGAGALSGSTLPLDPSVAADLLGMDSLFENSLEAVSDRDFLLEAMGVCVRVALHLSSLSEEWVLFSNPWVGLLDLPEEWTTGSSLMPHKRNPDSAELLRGRAGRIVGDLVSVLLTLKGLPLAYNRDLQETKPPSLDSLRRTVEMVQVACQVAQGLRVNSERAQRLLAEGFVEATDLSEWLVLRGVPFREAHRRIGELVRKAEERGCRIPDLPREEHDRVHPDLHDHLLKLRLEDLPFQRRTHGGSGDPLRAVESSERELPLIGEEWEKRRKKVEKEVALREGRS